MNITYAERKIEEVPDRRAAFFGLGFGTLFGFMLHKGSRYYCHGNTPNIPGDCHSGQYSCHKNGDKLLSGKRN